MSSVTASDIIAVVSTVYGIGRGHIVPDQWAEDASQYTKRRASQARLVAAYLMDQHMRISRSDICRSLGLTVSGSSYELVDLALLMVPRYVGYDEKLGKRVARAEQLIDDIHERRTPHLDQPVRASQAEAVA